ncbi:chromatin remodelling complex Rsc7/Swp82 subunit-domain-containing protein [Lipomyces chichibuensis]|uniref:chromatin remodelling complex Rsc7/Swp82 subunit-domain-containing protein n=1 Tax=Lipomyces chichibuensis TaxID=1546026 RepID=UPI003343BF4D
MADSNDSDYSSRSASPFKRSRSSSARGSTHGKGSRSKASSSLSSVSRSRSRSNTPAIVPAVKEDDDDDDPYIDEEGDISSNGCAESGEESSDIDQSAIRADDEDMEDGEIDETIEKSPKAEEEPELQVPVVQGQDEDEYHDDDDDQKEEGEIDEDEDMEDYQNAEHVQDDAEAEDQEGNKAKDTVVVPKSRRGTPSSSVSTPPPGTRASSVARNRRRLATAALSATSSPRPRSSHAVTKSSSKSKVPAPMPGSQHTTEVLNEDGDEYIVAEIDPQGEAKLSADGALLDGREFRMRTFTLPNRGTKIFMMATECAKELQYRDSYLLFNKNRSLYKLIATQGDKEALIEMGLLPYAYRSRQIALVSARSMFRAFGSLAVVDGRRVRDDYWEQKARDEGFTENDFAVEKKPVFIQHLTPNAHTATSTPGFQGSGQLDSTPSALESMVFQGIARGDSNGQIVFGSRGSSKIVDIPLDRIVRIFTASSNSTTDPQDEPMKFFATPSKGIREDTTRRAPLHSMVEAASAALEFNAFVGQKRRARQQMWKAYWSREMHAKQLENNGADEQGKNDDRSGDDSDANKADDKIRDTAVKDSVSVKSIKQDVEVN